MIGLPPPRILAANIAAGYAKRLLDQHGYDRLMAIIRRSGLEPQSTVGKHAGELLLYAIGGIADYNLGEGSFSTKFTKEVLSDIAPELAQRMLAGTVPAPGAPVGLAKAFDNFCGSLAENLFPWTRTARKGV